MAKPKVNTNPVANAYTDRRERIVEFMDPNTRKGGLIAFRSMPDGTLRVDVYRQDPGVVVTVAAIEGDSPTLDPSDIPPDFPVRPIAADDPTAGRIVTDGACGLSWDDSIATSYTPVPSGRCPFEYFHR